MLRGCLWSAFLPVGKKVSGVHGKMSFRKMKEGFVFHLITYNMSCGGGFAGLSVGNDFEATAND